MDVLKLAHALAGGTALLVMVVPMVSVKGGKNHRLYGKIYAGSMALVVVFALLLCTRRLLNDDPTDDDSALFLGMVGWLAADTTWFGWRTARKAAGPVVAAHRVVPVGTAVIGAAGLVRGLAFGGGPVWAAFGGLSMWVAVLQLRRLKEGWPTGADRIRAHLGMMIASCIATVTAFLVVNVSNAPEAVQGYLSPVVVWLLPTVIGVPLSIYHQRRVPDRA